MHSLVLLNTLQISLVDEALRSTSKYNNSCIQSLDLPEACTPEISIVDGSCGKYGSQSGVQRNETSPLFFPAVHPYGVETLVRVLLAPPDDPCSEASSYDPTHAKFKLRHILNSQNKTQRNKQRPKYLLYK